MSKSTFGAKLSQFFRTIDYKRLLKIVLMISVGSCIDALGAVLFVFPSGIITGGTTGLALFLNNFIGLPQDRIWIIVYSITAIMFVLGWIFLGKEYAIASIVSTAVYPGSMAIFSEVLKGVVITTNPLLCAFYGGLFIGVALSLVIRAGASSGGMDVPPLIVNKFTRIPLSVLMYGVDVVVLLSQAIMVKDADLILHGILLVLTYSVVMEVCISMSHKMQIKVVSKKYLEVRDLILHRIDRGVTLINGETGFEGKDTKIVLSVISNRELAKLERMVKALDPDAFIIISRVSEVKGRGFTKEKFYASKHGEHEPRPLLEEQTDTALSGMETEGIHLDEDTPAQED